MTEIDLDELLLEATEYPGWSSWCGDIIERLATALAASERQLAATKLDLAAAKSTSTGAVLTLAYIASLDISATQSVEQLVAPWRRPRG